MSAVCQAQNQAVWIHSSKQNKLNNSKPTSNRMDKHSVHKMEYYITTKTNYKLHTTWINLQT